MIIHKFILILSALILLTACSPLCKIVSPKFKPINQFAQITKKQHWWMVFNDPLMDQLAKELIQQNFDIKIAQARMEEARSILQVTSSGFFPDVLITGNISRTNNNISINKPVSITQGGFDTTWEIDIFGQTHAQVSAVKQQLNAKTASVQDVTNSILAELFRTIVEWRQANQTLKATKALLKTQDKQVEAFSIRVNAGLIDPTFLGRAKAQRAQIASQIPLTQAYSEAAQYKIERLLGKQSGDLSSLFTSVSDELTLPNSYEALNITIEVIQLRPDIRAVKAVMLAAQYDLAKAEANLWPHISISNFFGVHRGSDSLHLVNNPIWSIASSISIPILNFGKLHGAVGVANAQAQQASLVYENTILTALQETKTALADYIHGINAVIEQQKSIDHYKYTVKLANKQFEHGLIDMINLTIAQNELHHSTISLIKRKAATAIALIRLQKALGLVF